MNERPTPRPTVDIQSALRILRRRWLAILFCALVAAAAAFAYSSSQKSLYSATTTLVFRDAKLDKTFFGNYQSEDPNRVAATNVDLVLRRPVAKRTLERLRLKGSPDSLINRAEITTEGVSNVSDLTVTDSSAKRAAQLSDTLAEEFISERVAADRLKVRDAQTSVRAELERVQGAGISGTSTANQQNAEQARRLRDRLNDLDLLSLLQTGDAEIVQRAEPPTDRSSPRPLRTAVLGGFLGLLLGLVLALVLHRLDRRVREADEFEEMSELSILASVPRSSAIARSDGFDMQPAEFEAFRLLYAQLRFLSVDRRLKSLVVTSASAEEGKSVISLNLARAAAETGGRVLLLEADLRKPTLAGRTGLDPLPGLSDALVYDIESGFVQRLETDNLGGTLDVITAGTIPPNPAQLIQSERMASFLEEIYDHYDVVVIDTPPLGLVVDAVPLTTAVDGVVVVARLGHTQRNAFRGLVRRLRQLRTPVFGLVVNGTAADKTAGYYGYAAPPVAESESETRPEAPSPARA